MPKVYHPIILSPAVDKHPINGRDSNLKDRQSSPSSRRQATAVNGKGGVTPQVDRGPVVEPRTRLMLLYLRDRRHILVVK